MHSLRAKGGGGGPKPRTAPHSHQLQRTTREEDDVINGTLYRATRCSPLRSVISGSPYKKEKIATAPELVLVLGLVCHRCTGGSH